MTSISSPAFSATYDGDGLRATKTAIPLGGSSPVTTYFLYDGGSPLAEETWNGSTASLSAVNVQAADSWRARYNVGNQVHSFVYDPQGNVVQKQYWQNFAAAPYSTTSYEAYGKKGGEFTSFGTAPTHHDPAGFGGQFGYYTDVKTGLLCLTHRYYNPGTSKFLTRDPIGCGGG